MVFMFFFFIYNSYSRVCLGRVFWIPPSCCRTSVLSWLYLGHIWCVTCPFLFPSNSWGSLITLCILCVPPPWCLSTVKSVKLAVTGLLIYSLFLKGRKLEALGSQLVVISVRSTKWNRNKIKKPLTLSPEVLLCSPQMVPWPSPTSLLTNETKYYIRHFVFHLWTKTPRSFFLFFFFFCSFFCMLIRDSQV